ncbi:MAG: lipid-A-disaccharide synthase [Prevotellaceae bacterium]|jgi:lipid-A-disaccharide synthase|nr:lipid-A-disaccharide synthase [Prevotellaceae bacterium]
MKYYLIVGEASGDLHASRLMAALKEADAQATFRFFGGDLMAEVSGQPPVKHYKEMAYMGFVPVLLHLPAIFANMRLCKRDIAAWKPDVVIPVDYPGFNLKIIRYVKSVLRYPVYYYIAPKIWAWKEYRIHNIRRDVDELLSILPFEADFFEGKHHYPIHYVGNPTLDEVTAFKATHAGKRADFLADNRLPDKPVIALLAGSRKQEIKDNLPDMIRAAQPFVGHQLLVAGAPGIDASYYASYIGSADVKVLFGQTYRLLQQAEAALVTSGTATLETALFDVPQVVCYHTPIPQIIAWLRKRVLKVKYISLVNLIVDRELVKELVADTMTVEQMRTELERLLTDKAYRQKMHYGYIEMELKLGKPDSPRRAAELVIKMLNNSKSVQ